MEQQEDKNIGLEELREEREKTIKRWKESGLLDDLTPSNLSNNIAELFQCCPSYKINETDEKREL